MGNNLFKMDEVFFLGDVYVMIRDDVYVGVVVFGGVVGFLYGGWVFIVLGFGFFFGDGCLLYVYLGEFNGSGDDFIVGEFVSSVLMRCFVSKVEENSVNWDLMLDGGGWVMYLVVCFVI